MAMTDAQKYGVLPTGLKSYKDAVQDWDNDWQPWLEGLTKFTDMGGRFYADQVPTLVDGMDMNQVQQFGDYFSNYVVDRPNTGGDVDGMSDELMAYMQRNDQQQGALGQGLAGAGDAYVNPDRSYDGQQYNITANGQQFGFTGDEIRQLASLNEAEAPFRVDRGWFGDEQGLYVDQDTQDALRVGDDAFSAQTLGQYRTWLDQQNAPPAPAADAAPQANPDAEYIARVESLMQRAASGEAIDESEYAGLKWEDVQRIGDAFPTTRSTADDTRAKVVDGDDSGESAGSTSVDPDYIARLTEIEARVDAGEVVGPEELQGLEYGDIQRLADKISNNAAANVTDVGSSGEGDAGGGGPILTDLPGEGDGAVTTDAMNAFYLALDEGKTLQEALDVFTDAGGSLQDSALSALAEGLGGVIASDAVEADETGDDSQSEAHGAFFDALNDGDMEGAVSAFLDSGGQLSDEGKAILAGMLGVNLPSIFREAVGAAKDRLERGGEIDTTNAERIAEFYRKPAEEAAQKRLNSISSFFRSRGMFDSGRHGQALLDSVEQANRDIAENIDVPLIVDAQRRAAENERSAIMDAASLGQQQQGMELAERQQRLQETLGQSQKALQDLQGALARAEATGDFTDPETGKTTETLQAEQLRLQNQLAVADRTGQLARTVAAENYGINVSDYFDADTGEVTDYDAFFRSMDVFKNNYETMYGRTLTPLEAQALARGQTVVVSQPTLEGRAMDSAEGQQEFIQEMERADRTGKIIDPVTGHPQLTLAALAERNETDLRKQGLTLDADRLKESARQFTAEFYQRASEFAQNYGLNKSQTDATVANIYATMEMRDKELQQRSKEFMATHHLQLSELTGLTFGQGEIGADDLGVDLSSGASRAAKESAVRSAFELQMGRPPRSEELYGILQGGKVKVEGSPTLAAKQLAANISAQDMDRAADMSKFAKANGLEVKKFEEAIRRYDQEFLRTGAQIAHQNQLDQAQFNLALTEFQERKRAAQAQEGFDDRRVAAIEDEVAEKYGLARDQFMTANRQWQQEFNQRARQIAIDNDFRQDQFDEAVRQYQNAEDKRTDVWDGIVGDYKSTQEEAHWNNIYNAERQRLVQEEGLSDSDARRLAREKANNSQAPWMFNLMTQYGDAGKEMFNSLMNLSHGSGYNVSVGSDAGAGVWQMLGQMAANFVL